MFKNKSDLLEGIDVFFHDYSPHPSLLHGDLWGGIKEVILALGNDLESEATCHYIQEEIVRNQDIRVSRIGFGLPSGGGVTFADEMTLKSALESRRNIDF